MVDHTGGQYTGVGGKEEGNRERRGGLVEHQVKALVLHCTSVELTPVIDTFPSAYIRVCTHTYVCARTYRSHTQHTQTPCRHHYHHSNRRSFYAQVTERTPFLYAPDGGYTACTRRRPQRPENARIHHLPVQDDSEIQ